MSYQVFELIRNEKGFKNSEVAKYTGVSAQTLSHWKSNSYTPGPDKLKKLADFLAVPVSLINSDDVEAAKKHLQNVSSNTDFIVRDSILHDFDDEEYDSEDETEAKPDESKDILRRLLEAATTASDADLQVVYTVLLALKAKDKK